MLVCLNIEILSSTSKLPQSPLIEVFFHAFASKHISKHMLQSSAVTSSIATQDLTHHAFENKHPGKHIAAVALTLNFIIRTVGEYFTQTSLGKHSP